MSNQVDALFDALLNRFNGFVEGEACAQMLLWSPAQFAVDNAVGVQVEHEFTGNASQPLASLHHCDGVVEGFEVALQRAGVGRVSEPLAEFGSVGGRQRVANFGRKLDDGLRTKSAV